MKRPFSRGALPKIPAGRRALGGEEMREKKEKISQRLTVLVDRLRQLETREVQPHERPIVEVGILALRDRIRELGRQLQA